ncbi:BTAD domain-containing putative transcriptional regulator [Candidatus Chlorohelix sp.]|uniref:AfsR/SARP family transcriptional regulator n=1 Tax=Candidatus Chlorohelix sp. TaxID=3139201 RepID=UPI00306EE871
MTSVVKVRLLGDFLIVMANQPLALTTSLRFKSLLAYLVFYFNSTHSRLQLASLLWPESTEAHGLANLRGLLFRLRAVFPESEQLFHIEHTQIKWNDAYTLELDTASFEQEVACANKEEHAGNQTETVLHLERAVKLYGGELLPDIYDDWVIPERERLAKIYVRTVRRLAVYYEQIRDCVTAIMYAELLLKQNLLDEETYRMLMRLQAACDKHAEAINYYRLCAETLRQELDIAPDPATTDLYQQLLKPVSIPKQTDGDEEPNH